MASRAGTIDTAVSDFFVIAREPGADNPAIPTWACRGDNPAALAAEPPRAVERRDVGGVPGAFQLLGVLDSDECARLVELAERLGYLEDAAVTLPRSIRHNDNFTWVADDATNDIVWRRCRALISDSHDYNRGKAPLGLNARYRFYRYREGDYFAPHTDGSWPGSRVIDGRLVTDAWGDRYSQFSLLLFLSDGYDGGETRFFVDPDDPARPARQADGARAIDVRTPLGGALCFPHGTHPLHCVHASRPIVAGSKHIIRSDILFEL